MLKATKDPSHVGPSEDLAKQDNPGHVTPSHCFCCLSLGQPDLPKLLTSIGGPRPAQTTNVFVSWTTNIWLISPVVFLSSTQQTPTSRLRCDWALSAGWQTLIVPRHGWRTNFRIQFVALQQKPSTEGSTVSNSWYNFCRK